ncbi:hypothetical protein [Clostridium sp.]|uniref:hypothetical protein n=1 Tax=Clostridium sp. TaxID=1506 RepID=UPI002FC6CD09
MKNVVLINGSPKSKKSCSKYLLDTVKKSISDGNALKEINITDKAIRNEDKYDIVLNSDIILLAFPLYVDSLPSTVIKFLEELEIYAKNFIIDKKIVLYGIVNCGFFEGEQNKYALKVLRNYTNHIVNLEYGGGVGIGGGGFLGGSEKIPWEAKIKSNVKKSLDRLSESINYGDRLDVDIFSNINMSKRLYSIAGSFGWIASGAKNKIYIKGLFNKPYSNN